MVSRFTINECYEIPCSFKKMCFCQTLNIIMYQAQNVGNSHYAFFWKQLFVLLPPNMQPWQNNNFSSTLINKPLTKFLCVRNLKSFTPRWSNCLCHKLRLLAHPPTKWATWVFLLIWWCTIACRVNLHVCPLWLCSFLCFCLWIQKCGLVM
jgi:hypothetical protein